MGLFFRNLRTYKLSLSALRVLKAPEITSTVEFLSSKAGANGFSTKSLLHTTAKTFQKGLQLYLKRTSSWIFYFIVNLEKKMVQMLLGNYSKLLKYENSVQRIESEHYS